MPFTLHQFATIAAVMTFGSVVQGAVGFASGLLGVPLLVLCGFSLLDATVINFVSTSVQNTAGAVHLWSHLEPRELVWPNVLRGIALPAGIMALRATKGIDPVVVHQIVGAVVLGSVLLLGAVRIRPRDELPAAWTGLAFLSSGFLMGFASVGGAPMVLYVNSLTWSAAKCRGFLFFCSAILIPVMAAMLVWKFGMQMVPPALAALATLPLVSAGHFFGLRLGHRLDKALFRKVTFTLLTLIAISLIVSPLL